MLTEEEKIKLATVYEPIMFFHRDEKYEPISPARYMSESAMWCNQPVSSSRESWGACKSVTGRIDFPVDPLIKKGELSLDSDDIGVINRTFIGSENENGFREYQVSNEERELFIQNLSWSTGGPDVSSNIGAENLREMDGFLEENPSYYVDVLDQDTVGAIPRDSGTPIPPGFENALRALYPSGYWLLSYRFFFAYHEEQLTDCEIDSEVIRAKRENGFFAKNLHGSYEGDWQSFVLLIPNPGTPAIPGGPTGLPPTPVSPLTISDGNFPEPEILGFSRRARGVLVNIGSGIVDSRSFSLMATASVPAGETNLTDTHPHVYVARGAHNFYASPGTKASPKFDSTLPLPVELINTCTLADNIDYVFKDIEEARERIGNAVSTGKKAAIASGKILGGAGVGAGIGAIGGPIGAGIGAAIGAFGGAISAAVEGVLDPGPTNIPGQPAPPTGPGEVSDVGPGINDEDDDPDFGTIAAPSMLVDELKERFGDEVVETKMWELPVSSHIIDRTDGLQPWWEPDGDHPQGYSGLWGPRVEFDPFGRRTGTRIPAFEALFINAVLTDQG